jgi:hypothetical protein
VDDVLRWCWQNAQVAACVCLFSLDKAGAIPVDTHVWQLACRYYAPHLRNKTLNKQACTLRRFGGLLRNGWHASFTVAVQKFR